MQLGRCTRGGIAALAAILVVSVAVPAVAAARVNVPPGATEGDQYFEEVPNGGGSGSPNPGGGGGSGVGSGGGQGVAATQALNALGKDGQSAAGLANANRPPQGTAGGQAGQGPGESTSSSEGVGGMGFWFPFLLILTAVAAIAYGLRRRLLPT
jgi:hypothetical protein